MRLHWPPDFKLHTLRTNCAIDQLPPVEDISRGRSMQCRRCGCASELDSRCGMVRVGLEVLLKTSNTQAASVTLRGGRGKTVDSDDDEGSSPSLVLPHPVHDD